MKIFTFYQNAKDQVVSAVKNLKENPINNLGIIIPYLAVMVGMVGFLVAFILFIINGGYENQINIIRSSGINLTGKGFTYGTISIMYGNIVGNIIKIFLGSELILMIIKFYKESSNAKRIIISIDLGLGVLVSSAALIFVSIIDRKISITPEQEANLLRILNEQNYKTILIVLAAVCSALIIAFLILVLTSKSKWMLGRTAVSGVISFVAIPLILLFIENIIPLLAGVISLTILGIVLWFIFPSLKGKISSSNVSNNHNASKKHKVSSYEKPQKKPKKLDSEKNSEVVDRGSLGIKLYKVHGSIHDYVERDNGIIAREACTLYELRNGKYHFYDKSTGKKIKEIEIPWRN